LGKMILFPGKEGYRCDLNSQALSRFLDRLDSEDRLAKTILYNLNPADNDSFLSYPRHEYFRRTLCNLLGKEVEQGELPDDLE